MKSYRISLVIIGIILGLSRPIFAGDFQPPLYRGMALDVSGQPLEGRVDIKARYYRSGETEVLREEQIPGVPVRAGRFEVKLGSGASSKDAPSLAQLFAANPDLEMELSFNGKIQEPRIRIEPAGFSQADRALLLGVKTGENEKHWEGYTVPASGTAIQAVTLRPAGSGTADSTTGKVERNPFLLEMIPLGISPAVRDLPQIDPTSRPELREEAQEVNPIRHENLFDKEGRRFGTATAKITDPLAGVSSRNGGRVSPDPDLNFAGIGNVDGVLPPDTEGAVGPNNYVQVVNLSFAVFDKSGNMISGPANTNTLFSNAGGACASDNSGDAIFLYDEHADRWVLTQFAVSSGQAVCFAVSTTNDPTGTFYLYQLNTQRFPDYYKLGVWPDPDNNAYFMGTNTGYGGEYDIYAIDRAGLLAGTTPRPAQYFQDHPNLLMPADLDGDNLPPAGSPGIFYTFRDGGEDYFDNPPTDSLDLWEFDVDWDTPSNSTFAMTQSFTPPEFADFNWTICGFFESSCLPQPGTTAKLDSGSWWPMQRLQYRNFGPYETLVGTWTVDVDGNGDHAGLRWFELRRPENGSWNIEYQGTHAPDGIQRWEASTALDGSGNMAIGFSVVSAADTIYPSIRYATRPRDAAAFDAEKTLIAGSGYQTSSYNRWGDYASMEVDPVDDCTFWFTTEYIVNNGEAPWETRIGTFKVPGCSGSLGLNINPSNQSVCTAATGSVTYSLELSDPFNGTTQLSVGGCPAGATCTFSTNPVVAPATTSSLDVSGLAALTTGSYEMTITATDSVDPANTLSFNATLGIYEAAPAAPVLISPADGALNQDINVRLEWNGAADAASYHLQVADDPSFASPIVDYDSLSSTSYGLQELASNTTYYWRLSADNTCGTGVFSSVFSFKTAPAPGDCSDGSSTVIHFSEGFESGIGLWTHSGTGDSWAIGQDSAHGGLSSIHADDPDSVSDQYLVSPPILLSDTADSAALIFFSKQEIENSSTGCYDGAMVEISTDDGAGWNQLTPVVDLYDGPISSSYSNPAANMDAWCGDPEDWTKSVVMLSAYSGQTIRLRFRMTSDSSIGHDGIFLDDLSVQSCVSGTSDLVFQDSFDSGDTSSWTWSTGN